MLAPIVRTIEVPCGQQDAFQVFVHELDSWWPLGKYTTSAMTGRPARAIRVEARPGGAIVEIAADGTAYPWGTIVAYFVQLLIGLAFAAPIYAITSTMTSEGGFALIFRLGMIPMFLFSGAFFPIGNLDGWMEWLARLTPLWHGVDLTRMLVLGLVDWPLALLHVAYLAAFAVGGYDVAPA